MTIGSAFLTPAAIALAAALSQPLPAQVPRVASPAVAQRPANERTYGLLQFRFTTGDDDLRVDTHMFATISLAGMPTKTCELHGSMAAGGESNIVWDNHSTHESAPCRLDRPLALRELKRAKIELSLDQGGQFAYGVSNDNWNINGVTVQAYNSGEPTRTNLFCFRGEPMLVRMTGDMKTVTLTDLPTQC